MIDDGIWKVFFCELIRRRPFVAWKSMLRVVSPQLLRRKVGGMMNGRPKSTTSPARRFVPKPWFPLCREIPPLQKPLEDAIGLVLSAGRPKKHHG
jgi:hypothetical protein